MKHILLCLSFLWLLTSCMLFGPSAPKTTHASLTQAPFDAIIVPGVPYDGSHWSETMMARVKWSKYLYDKGYAKNIIYSGSAVYSPYVEAEIMALYAQSMGIPIEHIYTETRAEHSTENVYYSYRLAKENGFKHLALATDPFQAKSMRKFIKKFDFPVLLLPILSDTLEQQDLTEPSIEPEPAKKEPFVSIVERESFFKRLKGTFGQNIRWKEEDLKTKRLRKKYGDRIE